MCRVPPIYKVTFHSQTKYLFWNSNKNSVLHPVNSIAKYSNISGHYNILPKRWWFRSCHILWCWLLGACFHIEDHNIWSLQEVHQCHWKQRSCRSFILSSNTKLLRVQPTNPCVYIEYFMILKQLLLELLQFTTFTKMSVIMPLIRFSMI